MKLLRMWIVVTTKRRGPALTCPKGETTLRNDFAARSVVEDAMMHTALIRTSGYQYQRPERDARKGFSVDFFSRFDRGTSDVRFGLMYPLNS